MNPLPFFLLSGIGMGLWAAILTGLGALLGARFEKVERYVGPVGVIVIALLIVAFAIRVARKRRSRSA